MRKPFRIMFWILVVCLGFGLVVNLIAYLVDPAGSPLGEIFETQNKQLLSEKRAVTSSQSQEIRRVEKSKELQIGEERTPEHNLAIIHEGWKVPEDHTTVFRFRYLLRQLDAQCIQSKQEIADMTVKAQQVIREERGIKINLLSMVEEINKTMKVYHPEGDGDYAELLAAEMILWMEKL